MKWENTQTSRLLIVDDNPRIHEDFDLVFSNRKRNSELEADQNELYGHAEPRAVSMPTYELDHALSGSEGIEKTQRSIAAGQPYQVAFVDIRMPGMDGVETIERIWTIDSRIQTVICTAYADYRWEDLARRLGQSDKLLVLKKPFDHIEAFQLASTLSEKWFLARQAALKFEQMELLVAQRTQRVLDLQRREARRAPELEEMKRRILTNLSQEFRHPLALILRGLERMRGQKPEGPEEAQVRQGTERLLHLVEQFLDPRNPNDQDHPPRTAEVDLVPSFQGAAPTDEAPAQLEPPTASPRSAPALTPEESASLKEPPLILLVQDNADLALSLQQGFGPDYRTILVKDGTQGLIQARETLPDVIIAEVTLSILDGIELCRRLKNDELTSHIPVILLAAHDSETGQLQALEAGADDYIPRPFKLSLLKARVDNLMESRHKLHELFRQVSQLYPRDIATNQNDAQFIRRVIDLVEENMADLDFDLETMARKLAVSRRQLFRKLRAAAGCSPNTFIRALRLRRAAQLLTESQMTVTEITYAVGFSDLKYFRTIFREYYGVAPGEYLKHSKTP
ncbi:MAG TPA: response regulator [Candidatus Acidoferrales bacterium]|nr:response regulator [Candidatus Acidoferrales bacterium]